MFITLPGEVKNYLMIKEINLYLFLFTSRVLFFY